MTNRPTPVGKNVSLNTPKSKCLGIYLVRLRDHWIHHRPLPILWSLGTKPLCLTVSEIFNGKCDVMVHATLNDL